MNFKLMNSTTKIHVHGEKYIKKSKDNSNTVLNFSSLKLSIISLSSIERSIFTMESVCNTGSCSLIQELINTVTLHHIIKHYYTTL